MLSAGSCIYKKPLSCSQGQVENLCLRDMFIYITGLICTCWNSCCMRHLLESWSKFSSEQFFVLWWARILFIQALVPVLLLQQSLPGLFLPNCSDWDPCRSHGSTECRCPVHCNREHSVCECWRCTCLCIAFPSFWPDNIIQRKHVISLCQKWYFS